MSFDIGTFFDLDEGPARDQWGRPLLVPRGGTDDDRRWYTRASSLGDMIDDFSHLHTWEKRYLAIGLGIRPDLARLAAAETYTTGFDKGDERENKASGRRVDEIIERALEARKIHEKADYGTAVHARTEPGNTGVDTDEMQRVDVASFWDLIETLGIKILGTELFTACDGLWGAGTFDHLMYIPGVGIVITDKKTSSKAKEQYDVQLALYANADIYDYTNDTRQTLEEYVASLGWDPALIRRDVGFLFWIKDGRTTIRHLDLTAGWQAACAAAWVRDVHRKKGIARDVTKEIAAHADAMRSSMLDTIRAASSVADLNALWANPVVQGLWTEEHTLAAVAKRRAIEL